MFARGKQSDKDNLALVILQLLHSSFLIKKEPDIILPGSHYIIPFSKSRLLSGKRVWKSGTRGQQTVSPEVQRIFPRGTRGYGFVTQ